MSRAHNRIILKGKGHYKEAIASVDGFKPGMAINIAPAGAIFPVTATLKNGLRVVYEDGNSGKTVDDAYPINETMLYYQPIPGDEINVLVKAGENIVIGDYGIIETASGLFIEVVNTGGCQVQFEEASGGALAANTLLKATVL